MKRRYCLLQALLALCGMVCIPATLLAQTFTTLDYPGAASTFAYAINARGDILGRFVDAAGYGHAFYLIGGRTYVGFDCQGAVRTRPYGMNSKGEAVGDYQDASGVWHAFYLDMASPASWEEAGARCRTLDPKGSISASANGISETGEIAGSFTDAQNRMHAFLLWGQVHLVFDLVDGPTNGALTITPQGDPLGHLQAQGDRMKGWLLSRKGLQVLEFPPAEANGMSCPFGANSKGDIVGHYQRVGEQVRGFLYSGGRFINIEVPDSTGTQALGINEDGLIVGSYNDKNSKTHGFLLRR